MILASRHQQPNILVFEYVSGGGFTGVKLPAGLLVEGYAMLRSVLKDFKMAGYRTITILDSRITFPPVEADHIDYVAEADELVSRFHNSLRYCDASLIIAPEEGGILHAYVQSVKEHNTYCLNSEPDAISSVSDKKRLIQSLDRLGVRVPMSRLVTAEDAEQISKDFDPPFVCKPLTAAGCEGLSIVKERGQITKAVKKASRSSSDVLLQEYVRGVPASVSLLSDGVHALPLSLNLQNLSLHEPDSDSKYLGGQVPLKHPFEEEALKVSKKVVESISGLKGYVGMDLVLSESGPVVMEINPRLTVSYVGLREVSSSNLAQAMLDTFLRGHLPREWAVKDYALFEKISIPMNRKADFSKPISRPEVVSPPFPDPVEGVAYSLILASARRPSTARRHLKEVYRQILDSINRGV